ncbi:hypothetical protein Cocul_01708 [Corynebacterium oculi]|uniref:Uncharacterized protein n=1 Tax=Corynebacterium oculi TaxID=1544416 RepID=A0A0Q0YC18_9CORY|nr:hypothetical protein Cocul_01708 [Corynebacterium oculi]
MPRGIHARRPRPIALIFLATASTAALAACSTESDQPLLDAAEEAAKERDTDTVILTLPTVYGEEWEDVRRTVFRCATGSGSGGAGRSKKIPCRNYSRTRTPCYASTAPRSRPKHTPPRPSSCAAAAPPPPTGWGRKACPSVTAGSFPPPTPGGGCTVSPIRSRCSNSYPSWVTLPRSTVAATLVWNSIPAKGVFSALEASSLGSTVQG